MVLERLIRAFRRPAPETPVVPPAIASGPRPRIMGLAMVKNEQDIIEPFLRHNAPLLDALVLLDNASLDETRSIALACARELGNVILGDSEAFDYRQAERMTRLLHFAQGAFFADYILLLDADEFLSCPDRAALEAALAGIPPGGVGYLPWRSFVIRPGEEAAVAADPPRGFTHRRTAEVPQFFKVVLRLDGRLPHGLRLAQGNHDALLGDTPLPGHQIMEWPLLHFPVRSGAQIAAKGVVGWAAYLARNPAARQEDLGFQWREVFDRVAARGQAGLAEELAETSMRYAQTRAAIDWTADAVPEAAPAGYRRRHSTGAFADPLALLARSWERSLTGGAPPVRLERPEGLSATEGVTTTAFDAAWHWDHLFMDVAPFRYIAEKYQPSAVLDIGCGIGQYLALFRRFGTAEVYGIDGVPPEAVRGVLAPADYAALDLAVPLDLGRRFDLVVCVEVAEHMAAPDALVLLDSIERHATGRIVFSAAEPGQPGHGHINCQPLRYWLEHWAARGWVPHLVDSLGMRAMATLSWFRRNLVVLVPGTREAGAEAIQALTAIAERPYGWYGQAPGIRDFPLGEEPPGSDEACYTVLPVPEDAG
ncbi:glycosyltransferase family 2 protein [Pseudoroseomonas sp. WGS1072]|uniref:glycosyltransferase family 2 protein n=1 Tax=Roseomonas sp. WGS1072 TaxID=3366816 RepID=UPI003BF11749